MGGYVRAEWLSDALDQRNGRAFHLRRLVDDILTAMSICVVVRVSVRFRRRQILKETLSYITTITVCFFPPLGSKGPVTFYQRQIMQLADMTVLVRGNLSKGARTTVGALTVIDVHARDVIKKLVDDQV